MDATNPTQLPNAMSLEHGHSGSKAPNSPSAVEADHSPPVSEAGGPVLALHGPVSHEAILAASEPELVAFLTRCHVHSNYFDISRIVGLGDLPVETKNMVGDRITEGMKKVTLNPLEPDKLSALLLKNLDKEYQLKPRNSDDGSTLSPTGSYDSVANALERAAEVHAQLLQAGGIPVLQISDVGPPQDMTRENRRKAAMWLEMPKKSDQAYTEVLPVLSAQFEHWKNFQQYWQWGNRGDAGREKGLSLFLASRLKDHLDWSHEVLDEKSAAWYDKVDRQEWRCNQPRYAASRTNSETFAWYSEAMANRLKSNNFTRPYRLLEDPREQDAWTTAVEYLNYIYWEAERDTSRMKAAEPKYRKTMDSLLSYTGFAIPWFERNAAKELPTQLQEAEDAWRALFDKIKSFQEGVKRYFEHEANLRRDRQRSEWLLEQLASMEGGVASEKDALASTEEGVASAEKDKVALIEKSEATSCAKQGVDLIDQAAASSSKEETVAISSKEDASAISSKEEAAVISSKEEEPASVEKGSAAPVKEDVASFKEMLASMKEELALFKKKADASMKEEFVSFKKEILASVKEDLALFKEVEASMKEGLASFKKQEDASVKEDLALLKKEAEASMKEELASFKKQADASVKEELASFKKDILTSLEKEHASFLKVVTASTAEELASFQKSAAASGKEEQDLEEPRPANTEDERQESAHASATNTNSVKGVPGNNKQQPKKRKRNEGDEGSGKDDAQDTEVATAPAARISRAGSSKTSAPATKIPGAADVSEPAPKRRLRGRRQSPEQGDEDAQAGAADGAGANPTMRPSQRRKQSKKQKTAR